MNKVIKIKDKSITTNIVIKNKYVFKYLENLVKKNKKIFCIIDKKLSRIYKYKKFKDIKFIVVKSNESLKSIKNYNDICNYLLKNNIDRNSVLVAIGGGTIGDLSGFVACTLLRGIEFKLIPTTLLSQVDSSLGGKNGINSIVGKNLIGTFYHPSEVIIDSELLKSLPIREIKSGYAEILKHSIINDLSFFNWLDRNYIKIFSFDTKIIEQAILKSINIKLNYVTKDPYEKMINKNSRAMLNFGHTIGHSLETFYNYSSSLNHGEAISIGMLVESRISNKLGYLNNNELRKIEAHFIKTKLKMFDRNLKNSKIINILKKDKKNLNDQINIVLLKKIGDSFFARNIEINKIINTIKSF